MTLYYYSVPRARSAQKLKLSVCRLQVRQKSISDYHLKRFSVKREREKKKNRNRNRNRKEKLFIVMDLSLKMQSNRYCISIVGQIKHDISDDDDDTHTLQKKKIGMLNGETMDRFHLQLLTRTLIIYALR